MTSKYMRQEDTPRFFQPNCPMPPGVSALITMRQGGVSLPPFDSFNLAEHVGDDPRHVSANRAKLHEILPSEPVWLRQVHGIRVVDADTLRGNTAVEAADASYARGAGTVCIVMTADCLPVLFASRDGSVVAAAHAGWRGLCEGVLEATIQSMNVAAADLTAYLGPAIGPQHFEVGPEVRAAFVAVDGDAKHAFLKGQGDRWMADIYALARRRLQFAGLSPAAIFGGEDCTVSEPKRFFSYRRDKQTGRMAALIWRD